MTTNFTRKQKALYPHQITGKNQLLSDVYTIEFEKKFNFLAGQVVAIGTSAHDPAPRLYSIASGVDRDFMRILFDVNPQGLLTPHLAKSNIGDTIFVSEPFGKFTGTDKPAWFIASGTGVAPFISMLESGLGDNKTLLHGARTLDRFYFDEYFHNKLNDNYLQFCTTQSKQGIINGRLTNFLREQTNLSPDIMYYLCGSSEMIIEVREILIEQKGIPFENVIAEIYF